MKDEIERKKEKVTLIEAHSYTIVENKRWENYIFDREKRL